MDNLREQSKPDVETIAAAQLSISAEEIMPLVSAEKADVLQSGCVSLLERTWYEPIDDEL